MSHLLFSGFGSDWDFESHQRTWCTSINVSIHQMSIKVGCGVFFRRYGVIIKWDTTEKQLRSNWEANHKNTQKVTQKTCYHTTANIENVSHTLRPPEAKPTDWVVVCRSTGRVGDSFVAESALDFWSISKSTVSKMVEFHWLARILTTERYQNRLKQGIFSSF